MSDELRSAYAHVLILAKDITLDRAIETRGAAPLVGMAEL